MDLYTKNSLQCSAVTTLNYSTSFSMGIKMLGKQYHDPVYAIYAFVRFADEIVDTFFEQDQADLLDDFRESTFIAIKNGYSTNPILHSFQWVVNRYNIQHQLIKAFLNSMAMDLKQDEHNQASFENYVYGSAEVVGLMCLHVFTDGDTKNYDQLFHPARKLGEAFQKVNFLRDIKSDLDDRGRNYFPGIHLDQLDESSKNELVQNIEADFHEALPGIRQLNKNSRLGVYLAYRYYRGLLKKIKQLPANRLKKERIRIADPKKMLIFIFTRIRLLLNIIR